MAWIFGQSEHRVFCVFIGGTEQQNDEAEEEFAKRQTLLCVPVIGDTISAAGWDWKVDFRQVRWNGVVQLRARMITYNDAGDAVISEAANV